MKTTLIKLGIIVAIVLAILAGYLVVVHYFNQHKVTVDTKSLIQDVKKDFKVTLDTSSKSPVGTKDYRTPAGQNTFTKQEIDADPTVLLNSKIDSLTKALKIANDQVAHWQEVAVNIKGNALTAVEKKDIVGNTEDFYEDKYITIMYANKKFNYTENFKLNQVEYATKKFLWIRYGNVIDFFTDNPRATINSVKMLTITPTPNPWSLKVQAGASYDFSSRVITPATQVAIGYKNWNFVGGVTYDYIAPNVGFKPFVGTSYNLVNLH